MAPRWADKGVASRAGAGTGTGTAQSRLAECNGRHASAHDTSGAAGEPSHPAAARGGGGGGGGGGTPRANRRGRWADNAPPLPANGQHGHAPHDAQHDRRAANPPPPPVPSLELPVGYADDVSEMSAAAAAAASTISVVPSSEEDPLMQSYYPSMPAWLSANPSPMDAVHEPPNRRADLHSDLLSAFKAPADGARPDQRAEASKAAGGGGGGGGGGSVGASPRVYRSSAPNLHGSSAHGTYAYGPSMAAPSLSERRVTLTLTLTLTLTGAVAVRAPGGRPRALRRP